MKWLFRYCHLWGESTSSSRKSNMKKVHTHNCTVM